jgi:hypothetical protein
MHEIFGRGSWNMVKRFILTMIALGLLSPSALSQTKSLPSIENNLYVKSLFACLDASAKAYSNQTNSRHDYFNVIVEQDNLITREFPNQLGAYRIEYLDNQALVDRYKAKKASFPIIVIRPMKNEGAKLVISFADYFFSYGKKSRIYELEGGCAVELRYDCTKQEYLIEKVSLSGI